MRKSLFFGLVAVLGLLGCSRNQEIDVPDANLSLFARTESPAESRTVVESGVHVFWEPGDEIAVFMGEQSAKFTTDITAASGTATFKGTFGDTTWPEELDLWAVYPFSEDATFDGETITTNLPSEQVAREGSFGKDMNLSIAHSTSTSLQFYNVGGGIRFSVTEEGIKKVMFEGLSGEIISGKVQIGLEEGLPIIKEVTGGSQFITLLPPSGKETFEPGTWYYIVAIPGTLEGGYKLRFYKDSDYARKVSEKAVTIKRSIFGSLEKADEGIEYEAQITHFPETLKDWEESIDLSNQISNTINSLLNPSDDTEPFNSKAIDYIQDIDGVLLVSVASDTSSISYLQKDSVWCNYLLKTQQSCFLRDEDDAQQFQAPRSTSHNSQKHVASFNKALIYAPFQWDFSKPIAKWRYNLSQCYGEDNVILRVKNEKNSESDNAGILDLWDVLNDHYGFVLIDTHGTVGYTKAYSEATLLATSTVYSSEMVEELHKKGISNNQFGTIHIRHLKTTYFAISPDFLSGFHFDDAAVVITACKSAELLDFSENDDKGSMIGAFTNKRAAFVTGGKVDMDSEAMRVFASKMIEFLKNGFSFQYAFDYITTENGRIDNWLHFVHQYAKEKKIWRQIYYPFRDYDLPNNYICQRNTQEPFFLVNVVPILDEPDVKNNPVSLSWDCSLKDFEIKWPTDIIDDVIIEGDYSYFTIHYDVYVDGYRLGKSFYSNDTDKKASCTLSPGKHNWHVIAKIMEGDTVLASYQSDEGDFFVGESIPVESVSLDNTELELTIGNSATLIATILPENATNKSVSWSSSDESVATVTPQGVVTAISAGPAVISVTTSDGGKTASCNVTVKKTTVGGDIEGTERDPWN